jgi:hypothetical protein
VANDPGKQPIWSSCISCGDLWRSLAICDILRNKHEDMKLNFRNFFRSEAPGESEKKTASADALNNGEAPSREKKLARDNYPLDSGDVEGEGEQEGQEEEEEEDDGDIFVVNEHERWRNDLGWSHRNLEIGDPKRYVSKLHQSDSSREAALPTGWQFVGPWSAFLSFSSP